MLMILIKRDSRWIISIVTECRLVRDLYNGESSRLRKPGIDNEEHSPGGPNLGCPRDLSSSWQDMIAKTLLATK